MNDTFKDNDSKSSMREILENVPLYNKVRLEISDSQDYPHPNVIKIHCPICKSKSPFQDENQNRIDLPTGGSGSYLGETKRMIEDGTIYNFDYRCAGCSQQIFKVWIQVFPSSGKVQKVGQVPEWNINVDKQVSSYLGEDLQLYKRAKTCLSQSYGLGACAYMRRILENQVNSIIDSIIKIKKQDNDSEESIKELISIKKGKVLDTKLKLAYKFAPQSIIVEGHNPLKLMYELLSNGVHEKSEDDCTKTASQLLSIFEYVIVELKRQQENKEKFIKFIRSVSS